MTTDQVTTALRNLPDLERRALAHASNKRTAADPDNTEPMTAFWWSVWVAITDIETEIANELAWLDRNFYGSDE